MNPRGADAKHTPRSISVGSEDALAVLWQKSPTLRHGLVTQDGQRLRVIYPGRPNHRAGPDFRDAIIANEADEVLRGDVELHLNAPDWYGHGHHEDANYNSVVLHVVLHPKRSTQSRQHSGLKAPIVSLGPVAAALDEATPPVLNVLPESTAAGELTLGETLDLAGDERFLGRSQGFTMDLGRQEPDEVIYAAMMEALGYASNRAPFRELAKRVPFQSMGWLRGEPRGTRAMAIRATLLGASGLLPSVRNSDGAHQLKRLWRQVAATRPMPAASWKLFRVRPANHPLQRIAGAAVLVDRYIETGMAAGLEDLRRLGARGLIERLAARPYVGNGRAADVAVNVVLPFLHAYGRHGLKQGVADAALDLYRSFPALSDNEITREMKRLLRPGPEAVEVTTARRQQGLIRLYKNMPTAFFQKRSQAMTAPSRARRRRQPAAARAASTALWG